jgi:hypothetical protein
MDSDADDEWDLVSMDFTVEKHTSGVLMNLSETKMVSPDGFII